MKRYFASLILLCMLILISCVPNKNEYITTEQGNETSENLKNSDNMDEYISENINGGNVAVPETIDFSEFDFNSVDSAVITYGVTGYTASVSGDRLYDIIEFIKSVSGNNPVSSKGYYGFLYHVKLMDGDEAYFEITFMGENRPDENTFNYGIYEVRDSFRYPIRYNMDDVTENDVLDMFSPYFDEISE